MYKILIVEDDEVIGRTVQRHLQEWGYEAVCVNDLKHVLEEFAAFEPHLVLMDRISCCLTITAVTGAGRSGSFPMCR